MQERKVSEILNPATGDMCSGTEANNLMNEYFTDIGKNLADKIPISNFKPNKNMNKNLMLITL